MGRTYIRMLFYPHTIRYDRRHGHGGLKAECDQLNLAHETKNPKTGQPWLQFGYDTIVPTNDVKVLGVTLSFDLTMEKHVSNVCSAGFYRLRQLRRVRRSLDTESAATLMRSFVTSRIDYYNVLLAGAPKTTTDKLQRLLIAAAHLLRRLIVDCPS